MKRRGFLQGLVAGIAALVAAKLPETPGDTFSGLDTASGKDYTGYVAGEWLRSGQIVTCDGDFYIGGKRIGVVRGPVFVYNRELTPAEIRRNVEWIRMRSS